ncbi:hypothetical protein Sjap_018201 [Stephania japonica]|uniref:Uncharacterized protein n=1 Tax=Stephania japonica TaxID=461633 RepID=A0AAP0NMW8_9MAGN
MRKRKVSMSKEGFEGLFELCVSKTVEIGGILVGPSQVLEAKRAVIHKAQQFLPCSAKVYSFGLLKSGFNSKRKLWEMD